MPHAQGDIVVVADYLKTEVGGFINGGNISANLVNYSFTSNYSPVNDSQSASEVVGTALSILASTLEGVVKGVDYIGALPAAEKARLVALYEALHVAGAGVKAGTIDMATAHATVKSTIEVFLDIGGSAAVGIFMGSMAAVASSISTLPIPPHIRALATVGAAALGVGIELTLGNSGLYGEVAELLTDAIFGAGAAISNIGNALSHALEVIVDGVSSQINPFNSDFYSPVDISTFEVAPSNDDVNGIAPTFSNMTVFETAVFVNLNVQVNYTRSNGGGVSYDPDYVASRTPSGPMPEIQYDSFSV